MNDVWTQSKEQGLNNSRSDLKYKTLFKLIYRERELMSSLGY